MDNLGVPHSGRGGSDTDDEFVGNRPRRISASRRGSRQYDSTPRKLSVTSQHSQPEGTEMQGPHTERSPLHGQEEPLPPDMKGKCKFFGKIFFENFMGKAPPWYKKFILGCLLVNPFICLASKFVAGWLVTFQFIVSLALAFYCYPLLPGGVLILEAIVIQLVTPHAIYHHVVENLGVLLLLIFMVAGIHFMKRLLRKIFIWLFIALPNKIALSCIIFFMTAIFGAFCDSLTVCAVIAAVCIGFYETYHKIAVHRSIEAASEHSKNSRSEVPDKASKIIVVSPPPEQQHEKKEKQGEHGHGGHGPKHDITDDSKLTPHYQEELEEFRKFLRSILMHVCVATAAGGIATPVGEPQNLLIAKKANWNFTEYVIRCSPIFAFVMIISLIMCYLLEWSPRFGGFFGYYTRIPEPVLKILKAEADRLDAQETYHEKMQIFIQALALIMLVLCLVTHVAEVGMIGLAIICLLTLCNGVIDAEPIGESFIEGLPFTGLLIVFFGVAAIIDENRLFHDPIVAVLKLEGRSQIAALFVINAVLSTMSDSVFVATVFIKVVFEAWETGQISHSTFNLLAVDINISTNVPSLATPNGHAAFLFLYTSILAPVVDLSYLRMCWMAIPYFWPLTTISLIIMVYLQEFTESMVAIGWLDKV